MWQFQLKQVMLLTLEIAFGAAAASCGNQRLAMFFLGCAILSFLLLVLSTRT